MNNRSCITIYSPLYEAPHTKGDEMSGELHIGPYTWFVKGVILSDDSFCFKTYSDFHCTQETQSPVLSDYDIKWASDSGSFIVTQTSEVSTPRTPVPTDSPTKWSKADRAFLKSMGIAPGRKLTIPNKERNVRRGKTTAGVSASTRTGASARRNA